MKTIKTFLQMTFIAMTICLLTAATYAGNITIVTESQSTIVETDTVNVESDTSMATLRCGTLRSSADPVRWRFLLR